MSKILNITAEDVDDLRHMLGVSAKSARGYRNYYVAEPGHPGMARLLEAGLVVKNERYRLSEDVSEDECYHATLAGAKLVGLEKLPR
jgi:hypothetical protein